VTVKEPSSQMDIENMIVDIYVGVSSNILWFCVLKLVDMQGRHCIKTDSWYKFQVKEVHKNGINNANWLCWSIL
jgi:hypothetical protein